MPVCAMCRLQCPVPLNGGERGCWGADNSPSAGACLVQHGHRRGQATSSKRRSCAARGVCDVMEDIMDYRMPMPSRILLVALVSITLGFLTPVHAQPADPGAAALTEMLKALGGPSGAAGSSEVDQQVRALTGSPQLTQEVYNLAAQVLAELVQSSG